MPDTLHRLLFLEPGAGIWQGRGNSKWGPDKGRGSRPYSPLKAILHAGKHYLVKNMPRAMHIDPAKKRQILGVCEMRKRRRCCCGCGCVRKSMCKLS